MTSPPRRQFTLLDGMAILAAISPGLAVDRIEFDNMIKITGLLPLRGMSWSHMLDLPQFFIVFFAPIAAGPTPALLIRQAVPPRPARHTFSERPGMLSVLVATCLTAITLPLLANSYVTNVINLYGPAWPNWGGTIFYRWFRKAYLVITLITGAEVFGAWLSLALHRRWRISLDWIDRLGLCLGGYWILASFVGFWLSMSL